MCGTNEAPVTKGFPDLAQWPGSIMAHAGFPEHFFQKRLNPVKAVLKLMGSGVPARKAYQWFIDIANIEVFRQSHPHVHIRPKTEALVEWPTPIERAPSHHHSPPHRAVEKPASKKDIFKQYASAYALGQLLAKYLDRPCVHTSAI
jgi:hypothetical protein